VERPALQPMLAPFDGFHESEHAVTGTCLISFDRNRYSVMARAVRRAVQVRATPSLRRKQRERRALHTRAPARQGASLFDADRGSLLRAD